MEQWKSYKLGEILGERGYIRGPFGSALRRPELKTSGVPVYEQQNAIYNHREFRFFVDDQKFEELKRFQVRTNDLIISCSGTLGKVSIIGPDDPKGIISQALLTLRPNTELVDPKFLYYFLTSAAGFNHLVEASHGSVQVNIAKRSVVESIPLSLPGICTQKEIASILSAFDHKIELNRQMNATLEAMARALFKAWFVDFEPVHAKKENRPSTSATAEIAKLFPSDFEGGIPTGWRRDRISTFYEVSIGRTPPRKEPHWFTTGNGDVRWVSIKDMGNAGVFCRRTSEYLTEDAVKRFNVRLIPDMTVLLSFKLTVGRVCISDGICTTNEAIAHFIPKNPDFTAPFYLFEYLSAFDYQSLGSTSSIATAVNSKTIRDIPFTLPSVRVADAFEAAVRPLFEQIKLNQREQESLCEIRDSLLPRLISGKIRIDSCLEEIE